MSKSILMIDTPQKCQHCLIFGGDLCRELGASIYNFTDPIGASSIPYKLDEKEPLSAAGVYAKGWNACVNKILREAVENE